jgi:hypothetical protein
MFGLVPRRFVAFRSLCSPNQAMEQNRDSVLRS